MNVDKSSIFKVANAIRRSQNGLTIGEALRMAWKAAKLQVKLAAGEVRFRYRKVNGEIREAVGTLKNMLTETFSAFSLRHHEEALDRTIFHSYAHLRIYG